MELFNYLTKAHTKISAYALKPSYEQSLEDLAAVRTEAFKLQAFGRILKRAGKKSSDEGKMIRTLGDNLKTSAKYIEDCIGELMHHMEMSEQTDSVSRLEEAELRFTILKGDFPQHLDWIKKSINVIEILDLKSLYLNGLIKELKKLQNDIENIDPELLEDGTHELRRKLRWAIMYVIYPKGLFKYLDKSPQTNEHTKLTSLKGVKPVKISYGSIESLSEWVYQLGEAKDEGLAENYSKNKSEFNTSKPKIVKLTKSILSDLERNDCLALMRAEIKKQL